MTPITTDVLANRAAATRMIPVARIDNGAFTGKVGSGFRSENATQHSRGNRKPCMQQLPKFQTPTCFGDNRREARQ
jgi:hypothetical protein